MSNKFFAYFLFVTCLGLFTPLVVAKAKKEKNPFESMFDSQKKIDIQFKSENMNYYIPGAFFKDIVGNTKAQCHDIVKNIEEYPGLFTGLLSFGIGYGLYKKDILEYIQADKLVTENKNKLFAAGMLGVAAFYLCKNAILKKMSALTNPDETEDVDGSLGGSFQEGESGISSFSKSSVRVYAPGEIKTTFADVAGLETAKDELSDILMFLKDPEDFNTIGAKIPKGVLLSGSPGNGKTLLARALAGEVQCPFLYVSASEFIEAIVGVGAARVRSLFAIAKELAPCIIFIDEIDSVGRKRGGFASGGDNELAQTLNQMLAEMDGFEQQKNPIVILGATNRADILDSALTRPGRFDRKIEIASPFIKDRVKILETHLKNVRTIEDIDVYKIARGTPGYSGAELAQLVNEAAILALRKKQFGITMLEVDEARDNINLGRETKGMDISFQEYWQTAVHEAGHAIALVYQEHAEPLHKVTIVPRNGALGITFSMPRERCATFVENLKAQIVFALGGSVAEELIFKGRGVGASSDLKKARNLAMQIVMHYGLSDEFKDITFAQYMNQEVHLPDEISAKLQKEVSRIIHECRQVAVDIITKHEKELHQLVDMLLEDGTVYGSDVYRICGLQEPEIEYSLA